MSLKAESRLPHKCQTGEVRGEGGGGDFLAPRKREKGEGKLFKGLRKRGEEEGQEWPSESSSHTILYTVVQYWMDGFI